MFSVSACESPTQTDLTALTGVSENNTVTAGPPHTISIFGGNSQNATVSSVLTNPLSVRVTDSAGLPVSGVSVTFAVASGGGNIETAPAIVTTDTSGIALASARLGSTVGSQTFTATMPTGTTKTVTFTETALAPPSYLKIVDLAGTTPIPASSYFVGDTIQYRAILVDASGSFVKEIAANWSVSGSIQLSDVAITGGNPSKYATFSPTTTGGGTIQALIDDSTTISANNIVSTSTTTGTLSVALPLVPDTISIFSGNAQTGQVGTNLTSNLVVKVVNAANVPVPGTNVTFAVQSGGGQIISAQPIATDANGKASCTVKLGGSIGNTHSFTATMPSGTTQQVLFTASGTVGPATQLVFATSPAGGNTGTAFSIQPSVQVRDVYGNVQTSDSSSTVTLSIEPGFGQGTLGGNTTVTAVNGVANFTNVTYTFGGTDDTSTTIKLRATSSLGGVSSTLSSGFTVGQIIAAAQCNAAAGWLTVDGGCKDLTSGLVWSATSASSMTWHQAVWDSFGSGASAPESWEVLKGITADSYDTSGAYTISTGYDANAASYCHDLTESGYSDWRIPTYNEAVQANTDGAQASGALKNINNWMWVGTRNGTTQAYVWMGGNITNGGGFAAGYYVKCVRNPPATKLLVQQQVGGGTYGLGTNVAFAAQPIIRIADSTNSTNTVATDTVTLTVTSGNGQLCSTNTVTGVTSNCSSTKTVAAVAGVATFTNLSYSGTGAVTLTATATGLTSVTLASFTVNQTYPKANCLSVGGVWINAVGGCKDTTTGLIYNHSTLNGYAVGAFYLNWYDYIWDQTTVGANAGTQRTNDDGRTNDYDFSPTYSSYNQNQGSYPDNSPVNYCHSLQESGQNDWLPVPYEGGLYTLAAQGKAPTTYLESGAINTNYHWTSLVYGANTTYAYIQYTGNVTYTNKTSTYPAMCVRRDAPATLAFSTQPLMTNWTAGMPFNTQPVVDVKDADGAGPLFYDNSVITLTVVPASDNTGGTGRLLTIGDGSTMNSNKIISAGTSLNMTAANGRAAFTGLAYEKAGEKFRLRATATVTWRGTVYNLGPIYSNDITIPAISSYSQCSATNANWISAKGGCQYLGTGGLVWTYNPVFWGSDWMDAVWDSANGDPQKVGETATNDYDPTSTVAQKNDTKPKDSCHRLHLNGYYDWRMPTSSEVTSQMITGMGHLYVNRNGISLFNTSTTSTYSDGLSYYNAYYWYAGGLQNYLYTTNAKNTTNTYYNFCVREANASSLYNY